MMRNWLSIVLFILPVLAAGQDCSGKIQAARAAKAAGNYRLALAQFAAASNSCGDGRRAEIEKEILEIYDRIERLKNEALDAQLQAKIEAANARASEKTAASALAEARNANRVAQTALDSLQIVLDSLGRANEDKVQLILADADRARMVLDFDEATDKLQTARILRALPEAVDAAYQRLSHTLLVQARDNLLDGSYQPALRLTAQAADLNVQPDSVEAAWHSLRQFLLANARLDLLNTRYDAALEKINAAATVGVPPDTLARLRFELAFCYAETGAAVPAAALLDTLAHQYNATGVASLLWGIAGQDPVQQARLLRQARQQLDPGLENELAARYFPPAFVKLSGGTFTLRNALGKGTVADCPVSVAPFQLAAKEVTFFEYDLFCVATHRPLPADNGWGRGHRPVVDVNWFDAVDYCNWRSRQEGLQEAYTIDSVSENPNKRADPLNWNIACNWAANGYRLPTEVEWEFAAGNGDRHTRFSWGNEAPAPGHGGNVADESAKLKFPDWEIFGAYSDGFAYSAPVGSFPPNALGVYDMTGNVWEWCWDWYAEYFCRANKDKNAPRGPDSGKARVLRGGSWGSFPKDCLVDHRFYDNPGNRNSGIGFRLARK